MLEFESLLETSAARHSHLCPRQVLGVRMGLIGAAALGMEIPRKDKKMMIIVETDGCFADGVEVSTGCTVGHRTLRVEDYGKIAATFIRVKTGRSFRVAPRLDVRQRAYQYAPHQERRYFAQLEGYRIMPAEELFFVQEVSLAKPVEAVVSRAGMRVNCENCGEEIINEREVLRDGLVLCCSCAGQSYYYSVQSAIPAAVWSTVPAQETAS